MVFDKNYNQIGRWSIDTSGWQDFQKSAVEFSTDPNEEPNYLLDIQEEV